MGIELLRLRYKKYRKDYVHKGGWRRFLCKIIGHDLLIFRPQKGYKHWVCKRCDSLGRKGIK